MQEIDGMVFLVELEIRYFDSSASLSDANICKCTLRMLTEKEWGAFIMNL